MSKAFLDDYLKWLRHYQHAADGTLEVRAGSITRFLQWLGPQATAQGLGRLTPERIETFFLSYAQAMGRSARRSMQSALRAFLRFCLHQGYVQHPLDRAVPILRTYKLSTVPRGLSEEQAHRVIDSVDCSTNTGLRDYAILQLLHTYGVRGGQVRTLRVPYHPLLHSSSLSAIVNRYIRAAGINVPGRGAHIFRHAFATRMLDKGHSLKAVSDVLGHRHLSTTFIYTKVDLNTLKQVALDWPEEVDP